jgi:hypothetical protein
MPRVRSPNYPALSLPEAIKAVTTIQTAEQHLAAPKEVAAKHLGYTSYHGLAKRIISALENYGLLEDAGGDKVKVSSLAMAILYPSTQEEKQTAINEAAAKHPLFTAIKDEWQGARPSDENLRVYLIRRKFATDALDRVIQIYRETIDLVTPNSEGYTPANSGSNTKQEKPTMHVHQSGVRNPPASPLGEPFRVSFSPGGIDVTGRLTDMASADELIRTINALKLLLQPVSEIQKPSDEAAN